MNPPIDLQPPSPGSIPTGCSPSSLQDKVQLLPQIIYEKVSMPEEWAAIQTPRCAGENTSVWEEMGTLLLQHCHFGIFQELYTHLSTPWGSRHHEIRDDGCSISNSKSYCDFNWIPAAILFFSRASWLSISSLLPVIQQFIPHCTNPSTRQFLIPFKQCLWQQLPRSLVFGALPLFIK